jgi:outer membrane protein assembly factor BamD (BamD/ComL family)
VAIAAVAAGIGAFVANRGNAPAAADQAVATPPAPAPTTAAPAADAAPAAAVTTQASPTPPAAPGAIPPAKTAVGQNAAGTTQKPAPTTVAGAKPKPAATAAAAAPVVNRDTQATQLLDVAKAKLANNLNEQALNDLKQIINDFPGSRPAAEAAFLAAEIHEKNGRPDDAMAAYVEFESRFGSDRRIADAKLRRSTILARNRQPKAQAMSMQLLNEVARDFPGTPQSQLALQTKMKIETDRRDLRVMDPVLKVEVPAVVVTLRQMIEQFPDSPQAMAARNRLAMTFAQMNRHAEAAAVLEEMGAKGDNPMDVWFRLGELYERRLNNQQKAQEAYAKVPPGSPRYNDAQRKLKRK